MCEEGFGATHVCSLLPTGRWRSRMNEWMNDKQNTRAVRGGRNMVNLAQSLNFNTMTLQQQISQFAISLLVFWYIFGQRKRLSVGYVLAAIMAKRAQSSMISLKFSWLWLQHCLYRESFSKFFFSTKEPIWEHVASSKFLDLMIVARNSLGLVGLMREILELSLIFHWTRNF